jgi:hypothetical protein
MKKEKNLTTLKTLKWNTNFWNWSQFHTSTILFLVCTNIGWVIYGWNKLIRKEFLNQNNWMDPVVFHKEYYYTNFSFETISE